MSSRSKGARLLITALLLLGLSGIVAATLAWTWLDRPLTLATPSAEVSIEAGTAPRDVANAWVGAGVKTQAEFLYQWFRWSGQARRIRAGSYQIEAGTTPRQLLAKMVQGDELLEKLRLGEGWTLRQVRAALQQAPQLKPTTAQMSDEQLMQALGAPGLPGEGAFFPDTYPYSRGVSDLTVLRRARAVMQQHLQSSWDKRSADSPLKSTDQALILASIVEKETGPKDDPAMVAAVFLNRLRIGMPLQSDPTVIYGLGEAFDGNLRKRDLLADGPYNTYVRPGLPPTPIAMPSRASIQAVTQPAPTRALYFVARGDGSSVFSNNLAEHNRAVNEYQRNPQRNTPRSTSRETQGETPRETRP
jgi:UPF0755 protein